MNCRNDSDLEVLIEALRPFKVDQTIRNVMTVTNLEILASFMSERSQWYDGEGPIPEELLTVMQDKLGSVLIILLTLPLFLIHFKKIAGRRTAWHVQT